jgi:hypothetical protein
MKTTENTECTEKSLFIFSVSFVPSVVDPLKEEKQEKKETTENTEYTEESLFIFSVFSVSSVVNPLKEEENIIYGSWR